MYSVSEVDLEKDYADLKGWWEEWGWPSFPAEFLPQGILVKHNDVKVCAVFLYETNTPICWVENYISNKAVGKDIRNDAMDILLIEAAKLAKQKGFKVAMSAVKHNNLSRRLEDKGFVKSDTGLTNYIKVL